MKLKLYYLFILAVALTSVVSCSDDDDNKTTPEPPTEKTLGVPTACSDAFKAKYPNVTDVTWETKAPYYVAEFVPVNFQEAEAWFTADGTWKMTSTDYQKNMFFMPGTVSYAFEQTEYKTWTIDDITYYEYPNDSSNFYIIEVEQNSTQMDVYIDTDGNVFKTQAPTGQEITPDTVITKTQS